jgi:hypothetical protein
MAEMKKAIDETESILISSGEPTSANDPFKEIKNNCRRAPIRVTRRGSAAAPCR